MKNPFTYAALAILALYVTPSFLFADAPQAFRLAASLAPWKWDGGKLLGLALHSAAFAIVLTGAGGRALALFRLRRLSPSEGLLASLGLGAGAAGTAVLGLGLVGLTRPVVLAAFYVLLAANAFLHFFVFGHALVPEGWPRHRRSPAAQGLPAGEKAAFALLAVWVALFLSADLLAPEGFWDALVYHLASPRRWLEEGRITFIQPFFANFPLLQSMNYLVALSIRGPDLARGLNLVMDLALALTVRQIGLRWLDGRSASRAGLLVLTSPLLLLLSVHAGADIGAAFATCLAVLFFTRACLRWPGGGANSLSLVLAGVFAGLSYCMKPHGAAVVLLLAVLALPFGWRAVAKLAVPAAVLAAPWLVRAFLTTGDPFFPLLGFFFHSPFWTPFSRDAYGGELLGIWQGFSWGDLWNWGSVDRPVSRFKLGLTGPAILLAGLFTLVAGLRHMAVRKGPPLFVLVFAAALSFLWAFTVPAWRFYAAGFALLPLLLFLPEAVPVARRAFWVVVALQALWWPLVAAEVDRPWAAARGEVDETGYYAGLHANPSMDAFAFATQRLRTGPRSRILATGEVRGFLAPPFSIVASYFEEAPFLRMATDAPSAGRLAVRLRQKGVRYLLVNVPEMMRHILSTGLCWGSPFPRRMLERFFSRYSVLVYARSSAWIYRVGPEGGSEAVPECFRIGRTQRVRSAAVCAAMSGRALAAGDGKAALAYGYAAVAARRDSGLAWFAMGDAFFNASRWNDALDAYRRALAFGWRTSAVCHNEAIVLMKLGKHWPAQRAMQAAFSLDPNRQFGREMNLAREASLRAFRGQLGER